MHVAGNLPKKNLMHVVVNIVDVQKVSLIACDGHNIIVLCRPVYMYKLVAVGSAIQTDCV